MLLGQIQTRPLSHRHIAAARQVSQPSTLVASYVVWPRQGQAVRDLHHLARQDDKTTCRASRLHRKQPVEIIAFSWFNL